MYDHPIRWLNHNEGFSTALLTATAAIIAVWSTILTRRAFNLAVKQQRDSTLPMVIFDLTIMSYGDGPQASLIIRNIGPGPAINGKFLRGIAANETNGVKIKEPNFPVTIRGGEDRSLEIHIDFMRIVILRARGLTSLTENISFAYEDIHGRAGNATAALTWIHPTDLELSNYQISKTKMNLPGEQKL